MTNSLPKPPSQRRIVAVVDPVDIARGEDWLKDLAGNPHTQVLSSQPGSQSDPLVSRLDTAGLLEPNEVLLLSPYDDSSYCRAEDAFTVFSLQKVAAFVRVCQLLGAKRVTAKMLSDAESKQAIAIGADGRYGLAKASASGGTTTMKKLAAKMTWDEEFFGGEADSAAAQGLIEARHLGHDVTFVSLVESASDTRNRPKRRTITIDLTSEANRVIDAAGRIDVKAAAISAKLKRTRENKERLQLTLEVRFRQK